MLNQRAGSSVDYEKMRLQSHGITPPKPLKKIVSFRLERMLKSGVEDRSAE